MSVSLAMLVKDPPIARITMLIEYLRPIVSQVVIVVDDRTSQEDIDILTGLGAEIVMFHWVDDFAAARNAALPFCSGDWVLHLDPDELPSVEMFNFIKKIDERGPWTEGDPVGWLFWTRGFTDGKRAPDLESSWHCRMFRHGSGEWYKKVHEQVRLDGQDESKTRGTPVLRKAPATADFIHSFSENPEKIAYYATLPER